VGLQQSIGFICSVPPNDVFHDVHGARLFTVVVVAMLASSHTMVVFMLRGSMPSTATHCRLLELLHVLATNLASTTAASKDEGRVAEQNDAMAAMVGFGVTERTECLGLGPFAGHGWRALLVTECVGQRPAAPSV